MNNIVSALIRTSSRFNLQRACLRPGIDIKTKTRLFAITSQCYLKPVSEVKNVGGKTETKKPKTGVRITLLEPNNSLSVTTLEEAQKLSKRRNLKLVVVQEMDSKTQRPVYKLITPSELLAEEATDVKSEEKASSKKSEKLLTIGSRISDHDLSSRLKNIAKWLNKRHEVRVLLQGSPDDIPNSERIFTKIDESIKEPQVIGKIVQKRIKSGNIKFNILPVNKDKES